MLSVTPEDFLKLRYANSNKNESCGKCSILDLSLYLCIFFLLPVWHVGGVFKDIFLSQKKVFALCL